VTSANYHPIPCCISPQARLLAPDEEVAFNWRSHRAEHLLELALSEEPAPGGTPAAREAARKSRFSHGFRLDEVRAHHVCTARMCACGQTRPH